MLPIIITNQLSSPTDSLNCGMHGCINFTLSDLVLLTSIKVSFVVDEQCS